MRFKPPSGRLPISYLFSSGSRRVRKLWDYLIRLLVMLGHIFITAPPVAKADALLELFGTFHAMGVVVNLSQADDPEQNATAIVEYRTGDEPYRIGFPLTRVSSTRFVGSLFWLTPGMPYQVRVTLQDPNGGTLNNLQLVGQATTRTEIAIPTPQQTLFVSPTGSGPACTFEVPCTLSTALNQAGPGSEVVLRGGVYYEGDILLPNSGAPDAPLVIRGYEGETAVFDGADPTKFTWQADGNLYYTTVNVAGTNLVTANHKRLYPYESITDLRALAWNMPGFFADERTIYVHLPGGENPNHIPMAISRFHSGINVVNKNHVYFLNLTFRHYGQGTWARTLYFENSSYNLVQGSTFAITHQGIAIQGASHGTVVQHNEFYDTIFEWPWRAIKVGTEYERGGLRILNQNTGRGIVIRRNTFHNLFDGFGICPKEVRAETNETDVYENLIYNAADDAIETDGWCSNVRIWNNTMHDMLSGISLAPASGGPTYVIRNLLYRIGVGNNDAFSGTSFKFNSRGDESGPIFLLHNTIDVVLPGNNSGLDIKRQGSWSLLYARNNIWSGVNFAVRNVSGQPGIDLDYNGIWNQTEKRLIRWDDINYADLATFSQATGQEVHSYHTDPGFMDAKGGQYRLRSTSALIDAGVLLPGINDDYHGAAPDVGAFEFDGKRELSRLDHKVFLPTIGGL